MTKRTRLIALILSIVTLVSMFAINVFADDGHDHGSEAALGSIPTWEWITNIVILGVIAIAAVVLGIKFRVKLAAFLRSVKSELKKIVWASGKDTRKNFLVVAVITIALALVIGAADFGFAWVLDKVVELIQ